MTSELDETHGIRPKIENSFSLKSDSTSKERDDYIRELAKQLQISRSNERQMSEKLEKLSQQVSCQGRELRVLELDNKRLERLSGSLKSELSVGLSIGLEDFDQISFYILGAREELEGAREELERADTFPLSGLAMSIARVRDRLDTVAKILERAERKLRATNPDAKLETLPKTDSE